MVRKALVLMVLILLAVTNLACNTSTQNNSPQTTGAVTTAKPRNAQQVFEACVSPWDSDHDGFERLIREALKLPISMQTNSIYYDPEDSISDGRVLITVDYSTRNSFREMVRSDAIGEIEIDTCRITLPTF